MRLFPTPKVFSVSDWLELATNRLAAPARKRIGLEIEAHYAEAVQAHLEKGMSKLDAQAAALAELGDAWSAARRFRKQHLTEREAQSIKSMLKEARSVFALALSYILFAFCAYWIPWSTFYDPHHRRTFVEEALIFLMCVAIPTASYLLVRWKGANSILRTLILIHSFGGRYLGVALIFTFMECNVPPTTWLDIVFWIWPISIFHERFKICCKIRNIRCIGDELPPQNAALT